MIQRMAGGGYVAEVDEAGATLRGLSFDGRDLVLGYPDERHRLGFYGALLAPWPNRIRDGRYTVDGEAQQAAINEVERGTALHGLVSWMSFQPVSASPDEVRLCTTIPVQPGYPTTLEVGATYGLGPGGLAVTVTARNAGAAAAPYGVSHHPYLVAGTDPLEQWTLTLPAAQVLEVDDRLLPTGRLRSVAEAGVDLRWGRLLGDLQLDTCFTDVGAVGEVAGRLTSSDGRGVEIVADASWARWWQVFTSDGVPEPQRRKAVAIEPMSCPPDAFNSGEGVVRLEPGASVTHSWTIRAVE